jgi:cell division protein FtsZ
MKIMKTTSQNQSDDMAEEKILCVKIFGVGNTGVTVTERLVSRELAGVSFIAVNNDKKSLSSSSATEKIQLAARSKDDDGRRSRMEAEEHFARFKELCAGANVVFIAAGLGGASGTAVTPVLARAAKEAGALALAFVTLPFDWEGNRRQQHAQRGLEQLTSAADGVICLANQKIAKCVDEKTSVLESFKITNDLLAEGMLGMWRLVAHKSLIEIHFSDLCALLRDQHGESCFACAESTGPVRSKEVLEKLLAHPLLDGGQALTESSAVLVSLLGGPDLTMAEVNRVMEQINRQCERAQIIMGAAIDERFQDKLALTIVAVRGGSTATPAAVQEQPEPVAINHPAEELDTQLLNNRNTTARPGSRFVPPPPATTPEKMRQLAGRTGGRGRKRASGASQGQLPLEIISKGRFDKSEPTIHKGEDLDVPTYIRRGIALN